VNRSSVALNNRCGMPSDSGCWLVSLYRLSYSWFINIGKSGGLTKGKKGEAEWVFKKDPKIFLRSIFWKLVTWL